MSALGLSSGVLIVAGLAAQPAVPARAPERVALEAVAAVVDRKVVTVTEVEAEARLAVLEKAGAAAAGEPLDGRLLRTMLDHVVTQELLAVEARRTLAVVIKEGVVESKVQALREGFATPEEAHAFFSRHAIDDELLRARARRDLMNQALLSEVLARAGQPTDDEVKRSLNDPRADAARIGVEKERLLRARRDQAFADLMMRLKRELDVRVVANFDGALDGAAPAHGG